MIGGQAPRGGAHSWIRSNILGLVAIFIALSGSAVAANVASQPPGKAKAAAKKKKAKAVPGPQGPAGPAGAQGAQGAQGAPGAPGAEAFALINGSAAPNTVVDASASGITDANVVRQAAGLYCLYNLGFQPRVAHVTLALYPGNLFGAPYEAFASTAIGSGPSGDCPDTPSVDQGQIFVDANGDLGTFVGADVSFFLTLY